jgi:S1-C subfamily serine protease
VCAVVAQDFGLNGSNGAAPVAGEISPDASVRGTLYLRKGEANLLRYRFSVPEDAFAVRFHLAEVGQDLDLIVRNPDGRLLHYSEEPDYNESLFVSRLSAPPLSSGEHILEVAYQLPSLPERGGKTVSQVSFRLSMTTVEARVSQRLKPDTTLHDTLKPEDGMARFYEVEVPREAAALRIDISHTDGDLDLFVSSGESTALPFEADHVSQSLLAREHLVITPASTPPLEGGIYTITVLDQVGSEFETPFSLRAGFDATPPEALRALPNLDPPTGAVERMLVSTVELITGSGSLGSGVLVSPAGHILTNWHVVRDPGGGSDKRIYVAVTEDSARPPTEAFRARVIDHREDRDLALLQIVGDLYGHRIPEDYRFPFLAMGNDQALKIGDGVGLIGFPRVGGTGSRVSVTYSTGAVGGFEARPYGRVIKTDADANQGNSGGAAVDAEGELVGIPSHVVGLEWGHVGYIQPVSAVPDEWLAQISRANGVVPARR